MEDFCDSKDVCILIMWSISNMSDYIVNYYYHTDLIKPSNSLPTDILANGDMKTLLMDTSSSNLSKPSEEVKIKQNSESSPKSSSVSIYSDALCV